MEKLECEIVEMGVTLGSLIKELVHITLIVVTILYKGILFVIYMARQMISE